MPLNSSKRVLACIGGLSLSACAQTQSDLRVASVGSPAAAAASARGAYPVTSSMKPVAARPAGNRLLVTSGNILLGAAASLTVQAAGVVDGTVSGILHTSGQTLVQLTDGTSVLLSGTGGKLGESVSIDLTSGQVVGGSKSLVGLSTAGGTGSNAHLLSVGRGSGSISTGAVPASSGATLASPVGQAVPGAVGTASSTVTNTAGGLNVGCC